MFESRMILKGVFPQLRKCLIAGTPTITRVPGSFLLQSRSQNVFEWSSGSGMDADTQFKGHAHHFSGPIDWENPFKAYIGQHITATGPYILHCLAINTVDI